MFTCCYIPEQIVLSLKNYRIKNVHNIYDVERYTSSTIEIKKKNRFMLAIRFVAF